MYPGAYAQKHPDRAAFVMAATGQVVTYREYEERSNQLAHVPRDLGLRQFDHFSIFMENNDRYLEVCSAGWRSGLIYTPINSYLTAEELAYIVDNSESKVLITSRAKRDVAIEAARDCPIIDVADGRVVALPAFVGREMLYDLFAADTNDNGLTAVIRASSQQLFDSRYLVGGASGLIDMFTGRGGNLVVHGITGDDNLVLFSVTRDCGSDPTSVLHPLLQFDRRTGVTTPRVIGGGDAPAQALHAAMTGDGSCVAYIEFVNGGVWRHCDTSAPQMTPFIRAMPGSPTPRSCPSAVTDRSRCTRMPRHTPSSTWPAGGHRAPPRRVQAVSSPSDRRECSILDLTHSSALAGPSPSPGGVSLACVPLGREVCGPVPPSQGHVTEDVDDHVRADVSRGRSSRRRP